jgi:hypothetical protein
MGINVKPLTHWIIYRGYRVRFTARQPALVHGILNTGAGEVAFTYQPLTRIITLPDERVAINEHGWELTKEPLPYGPTSN